VTYRSREPDVDVPDVTLTAHVLAAAGRRGDKVALIDAVTGEKVTYRQLASQVDAVAAGLAAAGVRPGDVVALVSHNQPCYAAALHGALRAGATVTPINPLLTAGEMAKILAVSRASVVIAAESAAGVAAAAADETGLRRRFVLGECPGWRPFGELSAGQETPPALTLDPATAVAALPFSSGTTGLPKGVMLTHRNLVANLEQNRVGWPITSADVLAAALPFFHIYGLIIILNTGLLAGATIVTLPRFGLDAYLRMVEEHRVSRAFLAPPMVLAIANGPQSGSYDLSSLRHGICGAAPLDVDVARRAELRLGAVIRQGYGMTEASPGTHLVPDAEAQTIPAGSVGRLVPSTEARVVDPVTTEDVAAGQPGELWVRGPQVMRGYLNDPAATSAAIVDGGWLRTGDLVRVDDDEVFWIVDRLKELIKYKGYQVAPAELEALLLTHPEVVDAAVVGVPHEEGGEAPRAFVVTSGPLGAAELMAWVAARVAPYKKVRSVRFIDEIPRSPSGKILRRTLR
jgi:acyl-CoA synthetase (AMP-forming)/AMP-acid ligase II